MTTQALRPHLERCGYKDPLLRQDYPYGEQRVGLVGFADQTYDARSACVGAIDRQARAGGTLEETVGTYRALGTPIMFVCGQKELQWWIINAQGVKHRKTISPAQLGGFFRTYGDKFSPQSIYRAKTIARLRTKQQLDFVDIGLMPLLEHQMGSKLADLVVRMIDVLYKERGKPAMTDRLGRWLFQTAFWLLGAKILRDKEVDEFVTLDLLDVSEVFRKIKRHYNAEQEPAHSSQGERRAVESAATIVKSFASLRNLTMESLAYVYENALVTKKTRKAMGTHATPSYLVDYMVWQLAPWIEEIAPEKRVVLEPACGHAPFLTSAARLLRELIGELDAGERHKYLRERLIGFEKDGFAREVARLSLTLADVPNPNRWRLELADVYQGDALSQAASKSTILLCNPPFQKFDDEEQASYRNKGDTLHCHRKAAEVLWRTLPYMPQGSVFGVILPRAFLQDKGLADLRQVIINDFEVSEICLLPAKLFAKADLKSVALLGRKGVPKRRGVKYAIVLPNSLKYFQERYEADTEHVPLKEIEARGDHNLTYIPLKGVWEYCRNLPTLSSVAVAGRGIEYKSVEDSTSRSRFRRAKRGFVRFKRTIPDRRRGRKKVDIKLTQLPDLYWMDLSDEAIANRRYGMPTNRPRLLLNYVRSSRDEPWRLKALIDREGRAATNCCMTITPRLSDWDTEVLWSVVNSPLANAFVFCHSMERHNLEGTISNIPLPNYNKEVYEKIARLVRSYVVLDQKEAAIFGEESNKKELKRILLSIDAEVMRLYDLPPKMEKRILDLFQGVQRKGVDFEFEGYYPEGFESAIPLHEYLSEEYQRSTIAFADEWVKKHRSLEINAIFRKAVEAFEED